MPFSGAGSFAPYTPGNPVVSGTTISSSAFNNTIQDIATGLGNTVTRDGQSPPTADLPMASHKLTGLAAGSAALDSVRFDQIPSASTPLAIGSGGTGAITAPLALVALGAAPLAGPVFTGDPQAPTPSTSDNDTSIATTAFVKAGGRLLNVTAYTSSTTYAKSVNNPTFILVEVQGGGGGGGGVAAVAGTNAAGGSAGGYAQRIIPASSLAASETITIGIAGTGGAIGATGGAGGNSSFGTWAVATGGGGGVGNSSSTAGVGANAPGVGTTGTILLTGAPGQSVGGSANASACYGGNGGSGHFGGGGRAGAGTGSNGIAGTNGGGGAGACTDAATPYTGAPGGAGMVIVYEYI